MRRKFPRKLKKSLKSVLLDTLNLRQIWAPSEVRIDLYEPINPARKSVFRKNNVPELRGKFITAYRLIPA
jgi:hypothetical protein